MVKPVKKCPYHQNIGRKSGTDLPPHSIVCCILQSDISLNIWHKHSPSQLIDEVDAAGGRLTARLHVDNVFTDIVFTMCLQTLCLQCVYIYDSYMYTLGSSLIAHSFTEASLLLSKTLSPRLSWTSAAAGIRPIALPSDWYHIAQPDTKMTTAWTVGGSRRTCNCKIWRQKGKRNWWGGDRSVGAIHVHLSASGSPHGPALLAWVVKML